MPTVHKRELALQHVGPRGGEVEVGGVMQSVLTDLAHFGILGRNFQHMDKGGEGHLYITHVGNDLRKCYLIQSKTANV